MSELDYEQYHQKGGTYVIPVEVFDNLLEENQELKRKLRNQQKEFINYLEKEINEHKNKEPFIVANICSSYDLTQIELNILKDILQKYKSIIGQNNG